MHVWSLCPTPWKDFLIHHTDLHSSLCPNPLVWYLWLGASLLSRLATWVAHAHPTPQPATLLPAAPGLVPSHPNAFADASSLKQKHLSSTFLCSLKSPRKHFVFLEPHWSHWVESALLQVTFEPTSNICNCICHVTLHCCLYVFLLDISQHLKKKNPVWAQPPVLSRCSTNVHWHPGVL